jgi:signal transduction histidine kinase
MLEAVADYASIALMNAQLFEALETRARSLQKAIEGAKESELVKAEILQNVARELQTPLTAMQHQVELMLETLESMRPDHRESVQLLDRNLVQMRRVVESLRSLQKASAPQNRITVNLVELVQKALDRFESDADENAVQLETAFQNEPLLILADPAQISQVLDALLSNAIRFSAGGQVTITTGIGKNGMIHTQVEDTGPGIELAHQAQIFHPFYQVNTKALFPHDGLGIGLYLAKDIIKSHGGEMWVKSEIGSGSAFHFTLSPPNNKP